MKYFAITFKVYNNGTEDKTVMHSYDDLESAIKEAHTNYGQNVGEEVINHIMTTVINSEGGQYPQHTLKWTRTSTEV